jgi:hypothetical protein
MWWWHQLLSGTLPYGRFSPVSHRLLARPRTFHLALVYLLKMSSKIILFLILWLMEPRYSMKSQGLSNNLYHELYPSNFLRWQFKIHSNVDILPILISNLWINPHYDPRLEKCQIIDDQLLPLHSWSPCLYFL